MTIVDILIPLGAAAAGWLAARTWTGRTQRDTERRLNDTDAQLRSLVDHSASAICLKDREHRFLMVNRRHMELWSVSRDFQPGMTAFDIFPEEAARWFCESDDTVLRSGVDYTFEEEISLADGVHAYVTNKFPVRDAQGRIIAVGVIATDVTELKQAQENIARKEQLLRRLIDVQEAEKQRLCHEFHDGLIQQAVGSKMLLESLDRTSMPAECLASIDAVIRYLARGLEDGRRVIRGIRPAALDDLGLAAALEELCGHSWPGCPAVTAEIDPAVDGISASLQTTIYRVVQESLSNIWRHSDADRASVTVCRDPDGLDIVVADTGRGFDPGAGGRGFGLIGIGERIRLAGGDFVLESAPGSGTRLSARIPLGSTALDTDLVAGGSAPTGGR